MYFILISVAETALYVYSDNIIQFPFTPVALIGTAVAFIIGFQSNAAYSRIWEARQIWGGIVNSSRTFGIMVQDFINNDHAKVKRSDAELFEIKKTLIHRHIAWLTALRYAMRQPRMWEYIMNEHTNKEWANMIYVPEFNEDFYTIIKNYLSEEEFQYISAKTNKQTALLYLQSKHLRELKEEGLLWEFSFLELENTLEELTTHQGKSERIKNFPYPRQFASMMAYFTWTFLLILPLAMTAQFGEIATKLAQKNDFICPDWMVWLSVPFSVMVMWVFYTMNRIGRVGENPFEGSANDVPISAIARGIEIDLRQNLGENDADIPKPFEVRSHTQM
ncbi:bestrophin family protein [Flavobacterium sp.]|uniref:bestrophin family protein n=1 Tax=Flavobacterium sp. TaxID=239 RepID=UPI00352803C8